MLLDPYRDIQAKAGSKRFWTTREEKVLRENYAEHGAEHCATLLPGRPIGAVYQHAHKMGLKGKHHTNPDFRKRWTTSEQIDAVIRRAYQASEPKRDLIAKTAQAVGRPRWWVSKRAQALGIVAPRFKEPPWTQAEIDLAEAHAHKHLATIRRILKRHGFSRTETAIKVKLVRLGAMREDPNHYTAHGLAKLFGIDVKSVTRWIETGRLNAKRRGTDRGDKQGGDMWWIHRKQVRRFVAENVAAVDFRKVDKFWLVDLLVGFAE